MYHAGELDAQERAGERSTGERNGRLITNKIIPAAISFIERQPFFIAASQSQNGALFTSVLSGEDGYLKVPNPESVEINMQLINSSPLDPFWNNIDAHVNIGMLFIEPSSRKRFRVNGKMERHDELICVSVDQAYINCPKYIQQRHTLRVNKPVYDKIEERGASLSPHICDMISKADTFFVGSADDARNFDASHRGGSPGFVSIEHDGSLLIPDYPGNSMFNTLGNFLKNPKAGLVFLDFDLHTTLQLTGSVEIVWNRDDPHSQSGGTGRFWKFHTEQWLLLENLKGYDWQFIDYSTFNPKVG